MKIVRILLLATMIALVVFTAINWTSFATPTRLSIVVAEFDAPLGVILLGVAIGITLLFLVYAASLRASSLLEFRRLTRELEEQRALADQAEESRFSELRGLVEQGLQGIDTRLDGATAAIVERADGVEHNVRAKIEEATNALSSYIGQMDDKLDRQLREKGSS